MDINKDSGNYCVYKHTNKFNGKVYIGITKQKPENRWGKNGNGYKDNKHFINSIKKYGWNNFNHEVLIDNLSRKKACDYEIILIKHFNSFNNDYGYNNTKGGEGTLGVSGKLNGIAKSVICLNTGDIFESVNIASNITGVSHSKICSCCRGERKTSGTLSNGEKLKWMYYEDFKNNNIEINIKNNVQYVNKPHNKKIECNGIIYDSIREFSECYNQNEKRVSCWLNGTQPMPENFILLGLKYFDKETKLLKRKTKEESNKHKFKKVICGGITFETLIDCANYFNVKPHTISTMLRGTKKMSKRFIDLNLRYENENDNKKVTTCVMCDGIIYDSIRIFSKTNNLKEGTVSSWLRGVNKMPKEYINRGLRYFIEGDNVENK